ARLDRAFLDHLREGDAALAERLIAGRTDPSALPAKAESELLIAIGPHLEDFLADLFDIESDVRTLEAEHHRWAPLFAVKRTFVQRKSMNAHKAEEAGTFDGAALRRDVEARIGAPLSGKEGELAFANA